MNVATAIWFLGGLAALIVGAEMLVRGAVRVSRRLGISPLIVGLTVVAFGTSAPEFSVSVGATFLREADLAVGNVIGSNIVNILLILGLTALAAPLAVERRIVRSDVPAMIIASFLVLAFGHDGLLVRWEGIVLLTAFGIYVFRVIREARRFPYPVEPGAGGRPSGVLSSAAWAVFGVVGGCALLALGSRWMVTSGSQIAAALGMSSAIFGLVLVALGTSLPELASSIVAVVRRQPDIAVGNLIGSCIFNVLCVLGVSSAAASGGLSVAAEIVRFDLPVMIAAAVICLPIAITGQAIARWEGALLLGYYVAYAVYQSFAVAFRGALPTLQIALRGFVIPLTVVVLAVSIARTATGRKERHRSRRPRGPRRPPPS